MEQAQSYKPRVSRLALFLTFSRISLSSFGGAIFWARRELVERQCWLTERKFVDEFALGQLLPGPNVLNLTVMVGHLNERYPNAPIGRAIRRGLMPMTIGLVFASSTILMRAVNHDWRGYLITLVTVAVVLRKPWNPLWLFAAGALAGIVGLV